MRAHCFVGGVVLLASSLLFASNAQAADLTVTDLVVTVSGSTVTYSVTVCNQGTATSSSFFVDLYYDRTTPPTCPPSGYDDFQTVSGLGQGACTTRTFTRPGAPNGTYTAWARADGGCSISETNENNNDMSKVYVVGGVDLVVSSLDIAVSGTTVTYTITVCNQGAATSSNFFLDLYYDRATAPTCPASGYSAYRTISGLASGACATEVFTRTNAPAGTYTAWARADGGCSITEVNENNNNLSKGYTVGGQPDLVVNSFDITVSGSTVTYTVQVCNQGASTTTAFDVEVYYDLTSAPGCSSIASRETTINGLASGACTTVTYTRSGTPNGTYTGWARVDADCDVTESNESNNNASKAYSVGGPDLVVSSFNISVSGSTVTYTITICNNGTATGSNFYLDLYYNRSTPPTCSTSPNQYVTINGLGTGACTTRTFTQTGTPAGTYTGWARVDGVCQVNETNENNNNSSQTYSVGVPDLTISSFTTSVSGSTVTYTVQVCNNGTSTSSSFFLDLYYNRATAPTCGLGTYDEFQTITGGLAAGACTTRTFTQSSTPDGTYTAWAFVDGGCAITESNETNNTTSASYTVGQPDLVVSGFTTVVTGTTVTYVVTVCNSGGATTSNFYLDLYYNSSGAPNCNGSYSDDMLITGGLAAGACTTETFTQSNTPAGTYTAWAFVDGACTVTESNENNNKANSTYTVGVTPQADLVVSSFTTSVSGTTVTYTAQICNNGTASVTSNFYLDLYYNRATAPSCSTTPDQWNTITGLAAGACTTRTFTQSNAAAGSYTAWARVDGTCAITESNENNNNASSTYSVSSQPDLIVSSLTTSVNGGTVTYTVTVCNNGGATTSSFFVDLYYDSATAPTCNGSYDDYQAVSGLGAGACSTLTFTQTSTPSGSYTAWALADGGCSITEADETNNTASQAYTVAAAQQPDLVVNSFNAAVADNVVTFTVEICNNGTGAVGGSFDLELFYNEATAPSCTTTESDQAVINGLAAGACSTHTFVRPNTPNGSYTGWVLVDADCGVTESDENNNTSSASYTVLFVPPDGGVDALPDTIYPDQYVPQPDQYVPPQPDQFVPRTDGLTPQPDGFVPQPDGFVPQPDGGPSAGDGVAPKPGDGGCDCNVSRAPLDSAASALLLLVGLLILLRRRRD